MNIRRIEILGVAVSALTPLLAKAAVLDLISQRKKSYVCVAPVSTLVDCQSIEGYRDVVNQAAMVTPDGAPGAWLCRLKGSPEVRRTYGPDLMLNLCQETGIKHFFYGGTQKVLEKLTKKRS